MASNEVFSLGDFPLEGGMVLRGAKLAYKTHGKLNCLSLLNGIDGQNLESVCYASPTACLRACSSWGLRGRKAPEGRSPRLRGPKRTRMSLVTGCPTASHMRLTCRLRPSCTVTSSQLVFSPLLINFTCVGAVLPSARATPRRRRRGCSPLCSN